MALRLLTLDGNVLPVEKTEIIKCPGCGRRVVRNKGSPAFSNNPKKYFYCSDCQPRVEEKVVWTQGVQIRTVGDKK